MKRNQQTIIQTCSLLTAERALHKLCEFNLPCYEALNSSYVTILLSLIPNVIYEQSQSHPKMNYSVISLEQPQWNYKCQSFQYFPKINFINSHLVKNIEIVGVVVIGKIKDTIACIGTNPLESSVAIRYASRLHLVLSILGRHLGWKRACRKEEIKGYCVYWMRMMTHKRRHKTKLISPSRHEINSFMSDDERDSCVFSNYSPTKCENGTLIFCRSLVTNVVGFSASSITSQNRFWTCFSV